MMIIFMRDDGGNLTLKQAKDLSWVKEEAESLKDDERNNVLEKEESRNNCDDKNHHNHQKGRTETEELEGRYDPHHRDLETILNLSFFRSIFEISWMKAGNNLLINLKWFCLADGKDWFSFSDGENFTWFESFYLSIIFLHMTLRIIYNH